MYGTCVEPIEGRIFMAFFIAKFIVANRRGNIDKTLNKSKNDTNNDKQQVNKNTEYLVINED